MREANSHDEQYRNAQVSMSGTTSFCSECQHTQLLAHHEMEHFPLQTMNIRYNGFSDLRHYKHVVGW